MEVTEVEDDTAGDTVGIYRRIRVSKEYDSRKQWSILSHEWVHAVLHVSGVASVIPDQVEEIIAQSIEHALEEMLKQIGPQLMTSYEE